MTLSWAEAVSIVDYDPVTGIFRWKVSTGRRAKVGAIAGYTNKDGYWCLHINKTEYQSSRFAWFLVKGEWPDNEVDHINRNRSDNRWENLREATDAEQAHNKGLYKNNALGVSGVSKRRGKYCARLKQKSLGTFNTVEEAQAAYLDAKRAMAGAFAP